MTTLTILCITNFGFHASGFIRRLGEQASALGAGFVLGADAPLPSWIRDDWTIVPLKSAGYIESVLDQVIAACPDGYILRLDDDEQIGPQMFNWLESGAYREAEHWAFPRQHLWPDPEHYVTNPPLWPDLQTRLSVKAMAGGRHRVHEGSPYGTGRVADVAIEHHKFLARPLAEREQLLEHYETLQPGAGGQQFDVFSVPERYIDHGLVLAAVR
jgi:hypothetical protein